VENGPHYRLGRRGGPRRGQAIGRWRLARSCARPRPWARRIARGDAILKLALSPELDGKSGLYFNGQREARADAQAYDADARRQLKALSVKLTGLSAAFA
jgi:hypothetical protein